MLAVAIPVLFLHVQYQPGFRIGIGSTTVNAYLSDFAVLAVVLVAIWSGVRDGFAPLAAARWVWITGALFFGWIFVNVVYSHLHASAYPWLTHAVTGVKFGEYALLAPALPLLVRRTRDLVLPLWSLTLWSLFATIVGIAQFLGARIFFPGTVGHRQASLLGESDFAALSGAVLIVGLVVLVRKERVPGRELGIVATAAGAIGVILAAAVASLLGIVTAGLVLAAVLLFRHELPLRRAIAAGAVALVVAVGVVALRGGDLGSFARFLNTPATSPQSKEKTVQTYAHRTLLAWIGFKIWADHPVLGAGWESTGDARTFGPYLAAAHRRFPNEPAEAFPTSAHPYATQNIWIEALAELGVVGFVFLVSMFAAVAVTGWRAARTSGAFPALIGLGWTALVVWLWTAQSFVAGIPLDAVTWLGFGLVATGAATMRTDA